jgi:gluconolactonase
MISFSGIGTSLVTIACIFITPVLAQETRELAIAKPFAVVDLREPATAGLVQSSWQVCVARTVAASFKAPGSSPTDSLPLYPTGKAIETQALFPSANELDQASWTPLNDLTKRQGNGKLSYVWYRTTVTLPEKLGKQNVVGSIVYFEITADDYSEVYVNKTLKKQFGQTGAGPISGYNARNRIMLTDNAQPGQSYDIAVLVINGNLGQLPDNYVWIRNAVLDFYTPASIDITKEYVGKIQGIAPAFVQIIAPDTKVEKLAGGFQFTEGPVWHPEGFLLFSDPNMNMIYRFNPINRNITIFQSHSGYTGIDIGTKSQPGSNGLAIDLQGRLVVCQHGNRRVIRHEPKGPITVLADKVDGKRLNSPNDLVIKRDGSIYFSDPPYGLANFYADSAKELPYQGVFLIKEGKVKKVATDCGGPNGLAFSPDERYLYVTNWDIRDIYNTKNIWRYQVQPDGTLSGGVIFYSFNYTLGDEALDGMKIDNAGNLFVSAPGGVYIISSAAKLLGLIECPERPANMAWGDADGKTLYLTAHSSLLRIRTLTGGKIASVVK